MKSPHVTLSMTNGTGKNGNVAHLTITVNSVDATINGELVTVTSTLGKVTHYSPILITN